MTLSLYNTLTHRKEAFTPLDEKNVRMYVCGPTVYDRPHLGNARSVVVYDVLYRLLTHLYGKDHVTYVRNITDVDDKINAAAKANKEPISALTSRVEGWFESDMAALNCERPTREPHATQHIKQMIALIEKLIANKNAYVSQGNVLFDVKSYAEYGALSGRKLDELIAGARIEVESYKKHSGDFVLWKPALAGDDPSSVFDSPWGKGRPGWHIECSAMSSEYLGDTFDIHGGGSDLMFPHHENEIAQSRAAAPKSAFAKYWVHNGFLTVNGEKMSKSLGNFITVHDLLKKGVKGEVIRLAFLMTKYNEPLDWNEKLLHDAKKILEKWYRKLLSSQIKFRYEEQGVLTKIPKAFLDALKDDLNTPKAISVMHDANADELIRMVTLLGLEPLDIEAWFKGMDVEESVEALRDAKSAAEEAGDFEKAKRIGETLKHVDLISQRLAAKKAKNFAEADRIRKELSDQGIILEDRPDGTTGWRRA